MLGSRYWRRGFGMLVVLACAAGMVYYHLCIFVPSAMEARRAQGLGEGYSFGADFYPIWLTSREGLLRHSDPYSVGMTRKIQTGLFGRALDARDSTGLSDYRAFAYPAYTDVLFWPLALLSFAQVRIGLLVALSCATALSVLLWVRAFQVRASSAGLVSFIVLTLSTYAVLEGLFAEQAGLLVGFFLAASLAMLASERFFVSGSLLALSLIKPQMMLLVMAYFLFCGLRARRGRWRFVGGFVTFSSLLWISSLLIWPHWIGEWLGVVSGYRQYSTPPLVCYVLGDRMGTRLGPFVIAALLLAALGLAWGMRQASPASVEFRLTIAILLAVTTITILPGHAVYDHVLVLPGVILIVFSWRDFAVSSRAFRVVLGVTAFALFWQWVLAPAVIAMRLLLSPGVFASRVLMLPIRTAASIPFCVFALLFLMLRELQKRALGVTTRPDRA